MSLFDGFFGKSGGGGPVAGVFKAAKCKTLLKLTIPRIKLLRNRREAQLKQMRREIAKLLENGQEATARIRVEHIIREENIMAAQEIIELFCELIAVRLPIIEAQKECPLDLKEAISSICFAAPRSADLPELQQVQMLFAGKYGKDFVAAATELVPDCGVNRQIIELLSVRAPSVQSKMKLLKEIAEEHQVDWDPSETESEFLKPHEDLLNGPAYLSSPMMMPPPMPPPPMPPPMPSQEHHSEASAGSALAVEPHEEVETDDEDFDLDLPEVPKGSVSRPTSSAPPPDSSVFRPTSSAPPPPPGAGQHPQDFHSVDTDPKHGSSTSRAPSADAVPDNQINKGELPIPFPNAHDPNAPDPSDIDDRNQQYIPFVSSPPPPPPSTFVEQIKPAQEAPSAPSAPDHTMFKKSELFAPPPAFPFEASHSTDETHGTSAGTAVKGRLDVDFQNVLSAAQTAADRAEQAASAARAAAEVARLRISDMIALRDAEVHDQTGAAEKPAFDTQEPSSKNDDFYNPKWGSDPASPPPQHPAVLQRVPSQDDDPYSYPNLFSAQSSGSAGKF